MNNAARDARVDELLAACDRDKLRTSIGNVRHVIDNMPSDIPNAELLVTILEWAERDAQQVLDRMIERSGAV